MILLVGRLVQVKCLLASAAGALFLTFCWPQTPIPLTATMWKEGTPIPETPIVEYLTSSDCSDGHSCRCEVRCGFAEHPLVMRELLESQALDRPWDDDFGLHRDSIVGDISVDGTSASKAVEHISCSGEQGFCGM